MQIRPLDDQSSCLVNGFLNCATSCFVPVDYSAVRDDPQYFSFPTHASAVEPSRRVFCVDMIPGSRAVCLPIEGSRQVGIIVRVLVARVEYDLYCPVDALDEQVAMDSMNPY